MINLTKELPTEEGHYYWCEDDKPLEWTEIVDVELSHFRGGLVVDRYEGGYRDLKDMGGYWAKVDSSHFIIVSEIRIEPGIYTEEQMSELADIIQTGD